MLIKHILMLWFCVPSTTIRHVVYKTSVVFLDGCSFLIDLPLFVQTWWCHRKSGEVVLWTWQSAGWSLFWFISLSIPSIPKCRLDIAKYRLLYRLDIAKCGLLYGRMGNYSVEIGGRYNPAALGFDGLMGSVLAAQRELGGGCVWERGEFSAFRPKPRECGWLES